MEKIQKRLFTLLLTFSIVLTTINPTLATENAQPNTKTLSETTIEVTPTVEPTPTIVENNPTITPTIEVTPTVEPTITIVENDPTITPTIEVTPTVEPTITIVENDPTITPTIEVTPTVEPTITKKEIISFYEDEIKINTNKAYKEYNLEDIGNINAINDFLPTSIGIMLENSIDIVNIDITWKLKSENNEEKIYELILPEEYKIQTETTLPYIVFYQKSTTIKTILFENEDLYNTNEPYKTYNLNYINKNQIENLLPSKLKVIFENSKTIEEIDITWSCYCDPMTQNETSYIYNIIIPEKYSLNTNIEYFPYIVFNIEYTIEEVVNYNPNLPYKSLYIDYNDKNNIDNILPSYIEVYLAGFDTIQEIPVTWNCSEEFLKTNKEIYRFDFNISDKYIFPEEYTLPYINVNINKTITSFATENGNESYINTKPYKEYNIHYLEKITIAENLPKQIYAYINENIQPILIDVSWYCEEDIMAENKTSYKFIANIIDGEYKTKQNIDIPYITVNVKQTITSFVNYNYNNGSYATYRIDISEKNKIENYLPQKIKVYLNANITKEIEIPVTWKYDSNPNSTNLNQYIYTMNIPTTYELEEQLKNQIPYVKFVIIDKTQFSSTLATYNYTGTIQKYVAPKTGKYKLQTWGAQGGGNAGKGGYSEGIVSLEQGDVIYIVVGGVGSQGGTTTYKGAGYNGGGAAKNSAYGGGGATHIAYRTGLLSTLEPYKQDILIVAGGGGGAPSNGATAYEEAGAGGGLEGSGSYDASFDDNDIAYAQTGGTQYKGYAFGLGENSDGLASNGAGGGGFYGGYNAPTNKSGLRGGGGSGYVSNLSSESTTANVNTGNGKAIVTYLGVASSTLTIDLGLGGTWNGQKNKIEIVNLTGTTIDIPNPTPYNGYTFIGWELVSGDGQVTNNKYTYTFKNTTIRAKWVAPLQLVKTTNNNKLNFEFVQNDNYTKTYRLFQSPDKINWYLAQSNTDTAAQAKVWEYNYTGRVQQFIAPQDGYYDLEVWGAQGGGNAGGKGAYVKGSVQLKKGDILYVYVGGKPSGGSGGWNGGGTNYESSYGGGGATDIALQGTNNSTTWNSTAHLYSRIIVAGGGGGYNSLGGNSGGYGGWYNGGNGSGDDYGSGGGLTYGGDTSSDNIGSNLSNGGFGIGGSGNWCGEYLGAGGGGWYGGGSAGGHNNNGSGGGGSSYIYTQDLASYYPNSTYKPNSNYYFKDVVGKANDRTGNGYAKITFNDILLNEPYLNDISMQDNAAPNAISDVYMIETGETQSEIIWEIPTDRGTTYYHQVKSYSVTDTNTPLQVSNITTDVYISGIAGYRYYIDGLQNGTVTSSHTFVNTNKIKITKPTTTQYLHIAAVDVAGNIGPTYNFKIKPLTYFIKYHSNTKLDTNQSNTTITDSRTFYYGLTYKLNNNTFKKSGIGYYNQTLNYNFIGWGFKEYSPFTKTNNLAPYLYKSNLITKLTNFMTTSPTYVPSSIKNNPQERLYYYNGDVFYNMTNIDLEVINLYAQWIADNQRPYGGFTFKVLQYNDDGMATGHIVDDPYDSYNINDYNEISKTNTVYDDNIYFIKTQYRDPEGMTCEVEYQYSIDAGKTWYKLVSGVPTNHSQYLTTSTYKTSSGNLLGITFKTNKQVLIRMRTRDTVKYPIGYTYDTTTKTYKTFTLQKEMWSTGYFVDNSRADYDSTGKYLGDYGTKSNQGGAWYVKTINCVKGNEKPLADLVADDLDTSGLPDNFTYEDLLSIMESQKFFNFPMYDYTKASESWGYKDGSLYILISKDFEEKVNAQNDEELIKQFFDKNLDKYKYLSNTNIVLIKESNDYRYTSFNPEDENIAFLNASSDLDINKHSSKPSGHTAFSHYWIAICEKGTTKDVLTTTSDVNTTYSSLNTSNGTLYTKTYNGVAIKGHIYDSYEQMVKDIYDNGNALFATRTDNGLNMYDVYFGVCDKSWNLVSPNKWSNTIKKTLIVESRLSIYDVLFNDNAATNSNETNYVSLFRNENTPYYYISKYTLINNMYINNDATFNNGTNSVATLTTLNNNASSNYATTSGVNGFLKTNGALDTKIGYNLNFLVRTHGTEKVSVSLYNTKDEIVEIIPKKTFEGTYTDGILSINHSRKPLNYWYNNAQYMFAIPEQVYNEGYYLKVQVEKTPYTNKNKLTRYILIGDKNNPLFKPLNSSYSDTGVSIID